MRREIVLALEAMGFHVEAAHHEVAAGQHEIDFRYDDVLATADNISTFRFVVKNVAHDQRSARDVHAEADLRHQRVGHAHAQSLLSDGVERVLRRRGPVAAERDRACNYIGGLLRHAKGFCAITNPLVNSYKRLVPGYEAPDQHRVVGAQSQPARARAGVARRRHADRAAHAGSVLQSVSGAGGHAPLRARRDRTRSSIPARR